MERGYPERRLYLPLISLVLLTAACPELVADGGGGLATGGEGGGAGSPSAGAGGAGGDAGSPSAGSGGAGGEGVFPAPGWEEADPEEIDVNLSVLADAGVFAESIGSTCLLVVRGGKIVFERYANGAQQGDLHDPGSMGMAFTSTLVGIMLRQGLIEGVDEKVAGHVPEWEGTDKADLTVRHLLTMTPGLAFDLLDDNTFTAADEKWTEVALERKVAREAGALFEYSHITAQVFEPFIRNAAGVDVEGFARQYLFGPLTFDFRTEYIRNDDGDPALFGGVLTTCRDMARLGYLMLRGGNWAGKQVVDPGWVEATFKPDPDSPNQAFNNYFWLNGPVPSINAVNELQPGQAPLFPEAPFDLVMAMGSGQNFIDIRPSTDTVIVHLRPVPSYSGWDALTDPAGVRSQITNDLINPDHREMWERFFGPAGL